MILYDNWTRVEIDLDALEHNLTVIRSHLTPGCRVMAMIKADAYGHGAIPVARCLEAAGVEYFGVANIFEAVSLRDAGIHTPILISGYTPFELTAKLIEYDITQCIPSIRSAAEYSAAARSAGGVLKAHIKLDTGMSRYGIIAPGSEHEAAEAVLRICSMDNLNIEGIFSHLTSSDEDDPTPTIDQLSKFTCILDELEVKGVKNLLKHCANSAAVLKYHCTHFDMVRPGLSLFGLNNVPDSAESGLMPVMTMKAPITQLKTIPPGTSVSYGMTFTAKRPTRVATIPLGYGDGYIRAYSGAYMTVCGKPAPVIGRICMDICMLDVTDIPDVSEGDSVTVFGKSPDTTTEDLAKIAGTINYEVITGISKRVLRLYLRKNQPVERLSYI